MDSTDFAEANVGTTPVREGYGFDGHCQVTFRWPRETQNWKIHVAAAGCGDPLFHGGGSEASHGVSRDEVTLSIEGAVDR